MAYLDVREDLREGREPFQRIMDTVAGLAPGEDMELIAPFEPRLLYLVLENHGFDHHGEELPDGSWRVVFRPTGAVALPRVVGGTAPRPTPFPPVRSGSVRPVAPEAPSPSGPDRGSPAGLPGMQASLTLMPPARSATPTPVRATPEGTPPRRHQLVTTLPQTHVPAKGDLYPLFIRSSLVVALTLGFTTGTGLLLAAALGWASGSWWVIHTQIHGQAQLLGWAGLFLMGVTYHVYPRFKGTRLASRPLALASYWALIVGIAARGLGQPLSHDGARNGLLAVSAAGVLVGAALFAYVIVRTDRRGTARRQPSDLFLEAAVVWLLAGAVANAAILGQLIATGQRLVPQALDAPLIHTLLVGYLSLFTLGVAVRVLPTFLRLGPPQGRLITAAWWLLNSGLLLRVGAGWWDAADPSPLAQALVAAGTLLEAAGVGAFVVGLRPFGGTPASAASGYQGFGRFVRMAWGWLLVAFALDAAFAVRTLVDGGAPGYYEASAVRHALALGFLSLIIFGMASRLIPAFGGVALVQPRLLDWTLVLFNVGAVLRIVFLLAGPALPEVSQGITALSGVLGLAGISLFAFSIWRTLDASVRRAS